VKLNSANRSFFALVALAVVPYALLGLLGGGVLSLVVYRVGAHGLSGLTQDGQDLRPAALFFALIMTGSVVAALSVRRQVLATRRLADAIASQSDPMPSGMAQIADRVGLAGRVDLGPTRDTAERSLQRTRPVVAIPRGRRSARVAGPRSWTRQPTFEPARRPGATPERVPDRRSSAASVRQGVVRQAQTKLMGQPR
jgi:hypothetical protein